MKSGAMVTWSIGIIFACGAKGREIESRQNMVLKKALL
jgi:hypothetical protein